MKDLSRVKPVRGHLSYPQSISFLYGLQKSGIKLGLRNIRRLLRSLGNPEKRFASIHVAGSNGKGSTAAMIAAVLTAAGYRTGLYTSPHLISFAERIRINGKMIPQAEVARLTRKVRSMVERHEMTFFEATTAIAFRYFAEERVDVAVIETGLGGRLDATNVLRPMVSVVTSISLEHTQMLGNSLSKITYEKAGIIKARGICVTGVSEARSLRVLQSVCRTRGARMIRVTKNNFRVRSATRHGMIFDYEEGSHVLPGIAVSLAGPYQAKNAAVAIATLGHVGSRFRIDETAVREGLSHVGELAGFRGRFSVVARTPDTIADVAHNPAAMKNLAGWLKRAYRGKIVLLFGVMADKKVDPMIRSLKPIVRRAVLAQPRTARARSMEDLRRRFKRHGVPAESSRTIAAGLRRARSIAGRRGTVLVTGSHFVVGEALAALEGRKYLTINQ